MKSRTDWRVDIPCDGRRDLSALTLAEYDELLWQRWKAESLAAAGPVQEPPLRRTAASAAPLTTWLGPTKGFHDAK